MSNGPAGEPTRRTVVVDADAHSMPATRRALPMTDGKRMTDTANYDDTAQRRRRAWLAIALVAPAASVGVIGGQLMADTAMASLPWVLTKVYVVTAMIVWHLRVDGGELRRVTPRRGAYRAAVVIGLAISAVIIAAYALLASGWMDAANVKAHAANYGLDSPIVFLGAALYWIVGNAALEEFTFRWFVFRQAERVAGSWAAVLVSAGAFTAHHTLALANFADGKTNLLASAGVFAGGVIWSGLYLFYRSVLVVWVCHAIVDIAVFSLAGYLIFLA